jgi:YihY family inner membrane protein
VARILWLAVRNFLVDDALNYAAAVAFYALVSLGPALYLFGRVAEALFYVSDAVASAVSRAATFAPPDVAPIVERLTGGLRTAGGFDLIAIPALLWVSLSAFASLSRAINVAFGTDPTYRFWMSQLKAFAAVTISALLLVLSAASIHALAWLERYRERLELPPVLGPGAMWGSFALSLIVSFTAFFVFYKMLPHGKVSWRASATGALVAVVLWEGARRLFGLVLARSVSYGILTGTLAATVALLLWIYTVTAISLFGAELAAVLNGSRGEPAGGPGPGSSPP